MHREANCNALTGQSFFSALIKTRRHQDVEKIRQLLTVPIITTTVCLPLLQLVLFNYSQGSVNERYVVY